MAALICRRVLGWGVLSKGDRGESGKKTNQLRSLPKILPKFLQNLGMMMSITTENAIVRPSNIILSTDINAIGLIW